MVEEVKTKVDELLEFLEDKLIVDNASEISIPEIAKKLNVSEDIVESWAEILQENGIVKIKYKFATQYVELVDKNKKGKNIQTIQNVDYNSYLSNKLKEIWLSDSKKKFDTLKKAYLSLVESFKEVIVTILNKKNIMNNNQKRYVSNKFNEIKSKIVSLQSSIDSNDLTNSEQKIKEISKDIENEINKFSNILNPKEKTQLLSKNEEVNANILKLKKLEEISSLITQANSSISEGDFNKGKEIYRQIKSKEDELPKQFLRTKEEITNKIIGFNKKMAEGIAKKKHDEFKAKEAQINLAINELTHLINENKLKESIWKYREIIQQAKTMPEGFSDEFMIIKDKLNILYDKILKMQKANVNAEEKENIKKINWLTKQISENIKNNNYEEAFKQCRIARRLIENSNGIEFYEFEKKIDEFEDKILPIIKKKREKNIKKKEQELKKDIDELKELIKKGDGNSAIKEYAFISKKISEIDDFGTDLKIAFQEKLLSMYSQVNRIIEKNKTKHFDELSESIKEMIKNMIVLLRKNKIKEAQQMYNKILILYDELPKGFLIKKTVLRIEILSAYNQLVKSYNLIKEKTLDKVMNFKLQNVNASKKTDK